MKRKIKYIPDVLSIYDWLFIVFLHLRLSNQIDWAWGFILAPLISEFVLKATIGIINLDRQ